MKENIKWVRAIYLLGVTALVIGAVDPMEGSIIIAAGSGLIALSTHLAKDRHRNIFLALFTAIALGVIFLFYLSSLGGFGGDSTLSWWWGILILPYPAGWLVSIILLIVRSVKKPKELME